MTAPAVTLTADGLRSLMQGDEEWALLDTRAPEAFAAAHLLTASNLPPQRAPRMLPRLVPNPRVPVVLADDSTGAALDAAVRLRELGYRRLAVLEGGVSGWRFHGGELFSGVHVPSKAFGELVELHDQVPSLHAEQLLAARAGPNPPLILDSRPWEEYHEHSIPGAIDVPGAELVYRVRDLVPDDDTPVVVNCAGRTRSIIGCQSLREAGLANPVYALRNGTMGWQLAGHELATGATRRYPDTLSDAARRWALDAAAEVARRYGVRRVDAATLADWREDTARTLYLLDVRQPREFAAGHLPGAHSAPGGQLVQATDMYIAVRCARIVLVDDSEARALMTASWLRRLAYREVFVLAGGLGDQALESGGDTTPAQDSGSPLHWSRAQQEAYLEWEIGLVEQVARDGTLRFPAPPDG